MNVRVRALEVPCPRCHIVEGRQCLDLRRTGASLSNPHSERVQLWKVESGDDAVCQTRTDLCGGMMMVLREKVEKGEGISPSMAAFVLGEMERMRRDLDGFMDERGEG